MDGEVELGPEQRLEHFGSAGSGTLSMPPVP